MQLPSSPDVVSQSGADAVSATKDKSGAGTIDRSLRILMAEDNVINQRVGKLILQHKAGFSVDLVSDGNEAVEAPSDSAV